MSVDLKPYFDAAQAASEKVQLLMADMNAEFAEGEEGKAKALQMRPALDEAKKAADDANALYISMRNAASVADGAAKNFVPASEAIDDLPAKEQMKREDFIALDSAARMAFIQAGGKLVD